MLGSSYRCYVFHNIFITITFAYQLAFLLNHDAFTVNAFLQTHTNSHVASNCFQSAAATDAIEFQSDDSQFGRGEFHLSASLKEDDVVVYQTGSWLVDGVAVGDGSPPAFGFAKIENLQVVWTHNCEHGVLRGVQVAICEHDETIVRIEEPLVDVEFGPEQLVARLPVSWKMESSNEGVSKVPIQPTAWDYLTANEE